MTNIRSNIAKGLVDDLILKKCEREEIYSFESFSEVSFIYQKERHVRHVPSKLRGRAQ